MPVLAISEWSTLGPDDSRLAGRKVPDGLRPLLDALALSGRVEILGLSAGLRVRTSSWVGRLQVGDLTIVIEPKIPDAPFATLLRYAYGLRDLELRGRVQHASTPHGVRDLLIHQLVAEATELMARGLHRAYEREAANLASPRGRIDFAALASVAWRARASLPCVHHPRSMTNVLNVALLGALRLAGRMAEDQELRVRVRRLARILALDVADRPMSLALLDEAEAAMDRRHRSYEASFRIARVLLDGLGMSLDAGTPSIGLPGFLFDMNRFFQALLTRFLRENLDGHAVQDERKIKNLYAFDVARNPLGKAAPSLRPDILVVAGARVVAVLDAKYRDLWGKDLPAAMLYQLSLYALAHPTARHEAVIVYPAVGLEASEQALSLIDPRSGLSGATVVLRPLDLERLAGATLPNQGAQGDRKRRALAAEVVFGVGRGEAP